jgi:hypothetical protein
MAGHLTPTFFAPLRRKTSGVSQPMRSRIRWLKEENLDLMGSFPISTSRAFPSNKFREGKSSEKIFFATTSTHLRIP